LWTLADGTLAHEHKHTHQNLARASFRLLDSPFLVTGRFPGLTRQQIEDEIAQGVIDEDECVDVDDFAPFHDWDTATNWNSHFFEAKTGDRLTVPAEIGLAGCNHIRFDTRTNAAERAQMLYTMAKDDYRAGHYKSAFRILGRMMHLLEDMTSPAHVHDDPHAGTVYGDDPPSCGVDNDGFERWGYCEDGASSPAYTRICEYFYDSNQRNGMVFQNCSSAPATECLADFNSDGHFESYGVPPPGFQCRLWAALHILYDGRPVSVAVGSSDNPGSAFIRRVANVTYDFTTYTVHLVDRDNGDEEQPDSELQWMLRPNRQSDRLSQCTFFLDADDVGLCEARGGGWSIGGPHQEIGWSSGDLGFSTPQNWWIMPTHYFKGDGRTEGFAYIENKGGDGEDNFIPWRYGCTAQENAATRSPCSERGLGVRSKAMYQRLYGTVANNEDPFVVTPRTGKTLLRIYGDVLYPTAVAYGAGLIQAFVDDVAMAPTANAGGPYEGEACTPINFDGSESSDSNGTIVSYAWDFTNDGTFDTTSSAANYSFAYPSPFEGQARLRVTDNEGFTNEATADVVITPDVTAPVLTRATATPSQLWPPNHKMVPVTIDVSTAGACNDVCRITDVTSNEPGSEHGKGKKEPDWVVTGPLTVQLRAERSGGVTQRIYTVALSCVDAAGNQSTGSVLVTVPHDQRAASRKMDFNLDGWVDLLWHHQTTGQISAWLMKGPGSATGKHFDVKPCEADTNWKVVGSADFDQDGSPDLVWQNASNGRLRLWGTDNVRIVSEQPILPDISRDTGWKVKAVADFNQDGKPDLVWQHETQGRIAMWFMDGSAISSTSPFGPGRVADLEWKIVGSGDFDRDGWRDLVWQHQRDGRIAVWRMRGPTLVAAEQITPNRNLDWKIRGVGDIDGDDMPDLLWQHRVNGEVATWLMNGMALRGGVKVGKVPDTNWHIVGSR
jgi:hypothetical protein